MNEGDGELDSAVLRRTLAEEQRKEPKLMKIIQYLETKRQVQLELADDNTQPDPIVSMSLPDIEGVASRKLKQQDNEWIEEDAHAQEAGDQPVGLEQKASGENEEARPI